MGLLAQIQINVSVDVVSSPGGPGLALPRTGIAVASMILLACALFAAGVWAVVTTRTSRPQGEAE